MSRSEDGKKTNFPLGAYGLRIAGIPDGASLLAAAEPGWPAVEIAVEVGELDAEAEYLDEGRALLRLRTGGWIELQRNPGSARFVVPAPLSTDELVHPFLAPAAAVFAHWHGREGLHGGGLAVGGTAWGVIGDRLGGKSSLLAALAAGGTDVVCDDVLVLAGREAFSGPRTIDLREDAAAALGVGEEIGVAGARERWRLQLPPLAARCRSAAGSSPTGPTTFDGTSARVGDARPPLRQPQHHRAATRPCSPPSAERVACLGAAAAPLLGLGAGDARAAARHPLGVLTLEPQRLEQRVRPGFAVDLPAAA